MDAFLSGIEIKHCAAQKALLIPGFFRRASVQKVTSAVDDGNSFNEINALDGSLTVSH